MSDKKILIAEISGKRPGDANQRPTEKFDWWYDKVIISNNSEGYTTDWTIVDVPEDYRDWYRQNIKTNDLSYYAPMNRSYAIKYARENGYDYLVQLDDNIKQFEVVYTIDERKFSASGIDASKNGFHNHMINYMADVLDHTNAGIVGMNLTMVTPESSWLTERFVYSAFIMNVNNVPDFYQGDFEDDIEFRLKMKQMGIPMIQIPSFRYGKTSQRKVGDVTGNRQAYVDAGVNRGDVMSKLYGDIYSRGISNHVSGTNGRQEEGAFKHKMKPFKVGVRVRDLEGLKRKTLDFLEIIAIQKRDELKISRPKDEVSDEWQEENMKSG